MQLTRTAQHLFAGRGDLFHRPTIPIQSTKGSAAEPQLLVAIDRSILMAAAPRPDRQVVLHVLDFDQQAEFSLDDIQLPGTRCDGRGSLAGRRGLRLASDRGGFGGCTVSLVAGEAVERFRAHVAAEYRATAGLEPQIYVCAVEDGVGNEF